MTNYKTRIVTAIATGSVLLQAVAGLTFASTTIEITGNGAGSENVANVTQTSTTTVTQTNVANVTNNVDADADTGDNDANFNTGGNVTISTGKANVTANVTNNLNSNAASVDCCGNTGNTTVKVDGNGAFSNNTVDLDKTSTTTVRQSNVANVNNTVNIDADSGDNDAGFNTGGDVTIRTGNATVNANVNTTANTNWAHVGPATGAAAASNVSLMILDNGAGSENTIAANLVKTTTLGQTNVAGINNNVDADADTGDNDANFNTGDGDVVIDTGDASVTASIDNAVNFNAADVDCGCAYGLTAKIAGNGAVEGFRSDDANVINATLASVQTLGQGNTANLSNEYDGWTTDTGDNEAGQNTAGSNGDPSIVTGNATVNVGIENTGNTNTIGSLPVLPALPEVDFNVNWAAFWAFFGMSL